jgi:hypothetical protein
LVLLENYLVTNIFRPLPGNGLSTSDRYTLALGGDITLPATGNKAFTLGSSDALTLNAGSAVFVGTNKVLSIGTTGNATLAGRTR